MSRHRPWLRDYRLTPRLSTWGIEFRVRNGRDDAAEHGPRYREGGRTRETGS